jgi:hypothetical protein
MPSVTPFGDFTGDGWSDLIARENSSGKLYLYPGRGGGFPTMYQIGSGWNGMDSITRHGGFSQGPSEDVIAREKATGALWLYFYDHEMQGFAGRVKIGLRGWNGMREITPVGDFDGDGFPDLLAVESSTGNLYFYPGHGTSLGTSLGVRRLIGTGWNAMDELVGIGDFTRGGHADLIARDRANGDLWLYPGTGDGLPYRVRIGTGWNSMRDLVSIGDFNQDGTNDLLAVERATGKLFLYPGVGTKLFLYPGVGTSFPIRVQVGSGWTTNYTPLL